MKETAKRILFPNPDKTSNLDVPDCQVTLKSDANVVQIRELNVNIHLLHPLKRATESNHFSIV